MNEQMLGETFKSWISYMLDNIGPPNILNEPWIEIRGPLIPTLVPPYFSPVKSGFPI